MLNYQCFLHVITNKSFKRYLDILGGDFCESILPLIRVFENILHVKHVVRISIVLQVVKTSKHNHNSL